MGNTHNKPQTKQFLGERLYCPLIGQPQAAQNRPFHAAEDGCWVRTPGFSSGTEAAQRLAQSEAREGEVFTFDRASTPNTLEKPGVERELAAKAHGTQSRGGQTTYKTNALVRNKKTKRARVKKSPKKNVKRFTKQRYQQIINKLFCLESWYFTGRNYRRNSV